MSAILQEGQELVEFPQVPGQRPALRWCFPRPTRFWLSCFHSRRISEVGLIVQLEISFGCDQGH
jgi:hypothetical protein